MDEVDEHAGKAVVVLLCAWTQSWTGMDAEVIEHHTVLLRWRPLPAQAVQADRTPTTLLWKGHFGTPRQPDDIAYVILVSDLEHVWSEGLTARQVLDKQRVRGRRRGFIVRVRCGLRAWPVQRRSPFFGSCSTRACRRRVAPASCGRSRLS